MAVPIFNFTGEEPRITKLLRRLKSFSEIKLLEAPESTKPETETSLRSIFKYGSELPEGVVKTLSSEKRRRRCLFDAGMRGGLLRPTGAIGFLKNSYYWDNFFLCG